MEQRVRLRQVAVVASDLDAAVEALRSTVGLDEPYRDPAVIEFGLANAVFAVGGDFIEVVSPVRADTTAGRYLARRGGDSGYMAIFQVDDLVAARTRVDGLGVRIVWKADLADIAGTHLHPNDVPGAIVSVDWADPPDSWRWAGPAWIGGSPAHSAGGIGGMTVSVDDPVAVAARWAAVLGLPPRGCDLAVGSQTVSFVDRGDAGPGGIVELRLDTAAVRSSLDASIGGVRFRAEPTVGE